MTFRLRLPMSAHWALPDVSRTYRYRRVWHMPEEAISTGKVRSLSITGRVENVPLPPRLTPFGHISGRTRRGRILCSCKVFKKAHTLLELW